MMMNRVWIIMSQDQTGRWDFGGCAISFDEAQRSVDARHDSELSWSHIPTSDYQQYFAEHYVNSRRATLYHVFEVGVLGSRRPTDGESVDAFWHNQEPQP